MPLYTFISAILKKQHCYPPLDMVRMLPREQARCARVMACIVTLFNIMFTCLNCPCAQASFPVDSWCFRGKSTYKRYVTNVPDHHVFKCSKITILMWRQASLACEVVVLAARTDFFEFVRCNVYTLFFPDTFWNTWLAWLFTLKAWVTFHTCCIQGSVLPWVAIHLKPRLLAGRLTIRYLNFLANRL